MDLYSRQLVMIANQLHSLDQVPVQLKEVIKSLKKIKERIEKEVKKLEVQRHALLQIWQGEQLKHITSIPGLGKRVVAWLIVYRDGFKKIQNHRQLIAFARLAPREHTSGTSVRGRRGILQGWAMAIYETCYTCVACQP